MGLRVKKKEMVGKERNENESRTAGEKYKSIKSIRTQITVTKE